MLLTPFSFDPEYNSNAAVLGRSVSFAYQHDPSHDKPSELLCQLVTSLGFSQIGTKSWSNDFYATTALTQNQEQVEDGVRNITIE
jgi:hypothetical protein